MEAWCVVSALVVLEVWSVELTQPVLAGCLFSPCKCRALAQDSLGCADSPETQYAEPAQDKEVYWRPGALSAYFYWGCLSGFRASRVPTYCRLSSCAISTCLHGKRSSPASISSHVQDPLPSSISSHVHAVCSIIRCLAAWSLFGGLFCQVRGMEEAEAQHDKST